MDSPNRYAPPTHAAADIYAGADSTDASVFAVLEGMLALVGAAPRGELRFVTDR